MMWKRRGAGKASQISNMCLIDYLLFPSTGIGLKRQGAIAHGCAHCDFRFQRGGETSEAWPPHFLNK